MTDDSEALNRLICDKIALALLECPVASIVIVSWKIQPGADYADFAVAAWPGKYRNVVHGLLSPDYDHVVIESELWKKSSA